MNAKYKVRLTSVLSVDFELTCWENAPPPGQVPEIIQVGVVEIDNETLSPKRANAWYVKNEYSEVSEYCASLTGITPSTLRRRGLPLGEVGRLLAKNFGSRNKGWMAWGSDKAAIDRDCALKSVDPFFSNAFFDVGLLYSMVMQESRAVGLDEAAERLAIPYVGVRHDALADAGVLGGVWGELVRAVRERMPTPPSTPGFSV